jgi:hypothetical protein
MADVVRAQNFFRLLGTHDEADFASDCTVLSHVALRSRQEVAIISSLNRWKWLTVACKIGFRFLHARDTFLPWYGKGLMALL